MKEKRMKEIQMKEETITHECQRNVPRTFRDNVYYNGKKASMW